MPRMPEGRARGLPEPATLRVLCGCAWDVPLHCKTRTKTEKLDNQQFPKHLEHTRRHSQKCKKSGKSWKHAKIVRENPQGLCMHTCICISNIWAKHSRHAKSVLKSRKSCKNPLLGIQKWSREIMHLGRSASTL